MTSATPPERRPAVGHPTAGPAPGLEHLGGGARPEPLATDGVGVVTVGTGLWAVALLALLPFWDRLDDAGRLWWVPACATGLVLGLIGIVYTRRRRHALRQEGADALAAALRGDTRIDAALVTELPHRGQDWVPVEDEPPER